MRPAQLIARGGLDTSIRREIEKLDLGVRREPYDDLPGSVYIVQLDASRRRISRKVLDSVVSVEPSEVAIVVLEDAFLSVCIDGDFRGRDWSGEDDELRSGELHRQVYL